jgi:hypothetical protein
MRAGSMSAQFPGWGRMGEASLMGLLPWVQVGYR